MKTKIILLGLLFLAATCGFAQTWQAGTAKLFTSPDSTKVGIGISSPLERLHINNGALKIGNLSSAAARAVNMIKIGDGNYVQIGEWEADDMLSFKASKYNFTTGNVGIGVAAPAYKLDINGILRLKTVVYSSWNQSFLYWDYHSLVMGTPPGVYSHCALDLTPGGENSHNDTLSSQLRMYSAPNSTDRIIRIRLYTEGNCWFLNPGNFGIGTIDPQYKLDVRGTVRADEIIVNTMGADYVFDEDYNLKPLEEVETYIEENKHLPDIPSAEQVQQEGMRVSDMQTLLLQKVEELTLYIIEQNKKIQQLEQTISLLNQQYK